MTAKYVAALLLLCAIASCAEQNLADAMREIGFIGVWSEECADPRKPKQVGWEPGASTLPMRGMYGVPIGNRPGGMRWERLSTDKLQLTILGRVAAEDSRLLYEKVGDKIRFNGKMLEKCRD
jgi:hypothetical protein